MAGPTPWVVKPGSLAGFLRRAPLAVLLLGPRLGLRFSPAVARGLDAAHGRNLSIGTFDRARASGPRWLLDHLGPAFDAAPAEVPDGYYLFRSARAIAYHPGALDREPAPRSLLGVIAVAADVAARAVDPLDAVSARAVLDAFDAAIAGAPRPAAGPDPDDPYAVLKVAPTATDRELKAARDKALLENHPDRVAQMGDDIRALAKRNTQAIHDAYQAIRAERRKP